MIQKCGVRLNIWVAERVVKGDESLHLQADLATVNSPETRGLKMQLATEQVLSFQIREDILIDGIFYPHIMQERSITYSLK